MSPARLAQSCSRFAPFATTLEAREGAAGLVLVEVSLEKLRAHLAAVSAGER